MTNFNEQIEMLNGKINENQEAVDVLLGDVKVFKDAKTRIGQIYTNADKNAFLATNNQLQFALDSVNLFIGKTIDGLNEQINDLKTSRKKLDKALETLTDLSESMSA